MIKDPIIFLKHILIEIEKIENSINIMTKKEFLKNLDVQDAVIRRIEVVGEAVKNIPLSFKTKHLDVEWKKIAGTRDILIHAYFSIDLDLVWVIATRDILLLKKQIEKILSKD